MIENLLIAIGALTCTTAVIAILNVLWSWYVGVKIDTTYARSPATSWSGMTNQEIARERFCHYQRDLHHFTHRISPFMTDARSHAAARRDIDQSHGVIDGWIEVNGEMFDQRVD